VPPPLLLQNAEDHFIWKVYWIEITPYVISYAQEVGTRGKMERSLYLQKTDNITWLVHTLQVWQKFLLELYLDVFQTWNYSFSNLLLIAITHGHNVI